ncbi:solute carrier family 2, facilitated glucose transporter member 8-like [Ornithodoros turicata]|uniref:solute carrier family 2, facilitated glucose transporter member 8-like n=1 Tax=Ornithodoros turicata TaxID=34597 RepID=UPI003138B0FB
MPATEKSRGGFELFYTATSSAWLGSVAMGTCLGYSSPAIPSLREANGTSSIMLSESEESWFGSIMTLGALICSPLAGMLVDWTGRRWAMLITSAGFLVAWLLIGFAGNLALLYLGRFLTGCFTGVISLAVPVYVSEISRPEVRGILGAGIQLSVTLGILMVYISGKYFEWNALAFICIGPPGAMALLMTFMAESPRWLLRKGRRQEALKALQFLYSKDTDYEAECHLIEENIRMSPKERFHIRELGQPYIFKPILLSLFLMFSQQYSGINAIMFYAVSIFEATGVNIDPKNCMIIIGVVQVGATLAATLVMDCVGRRLLLQCSLGLIGASLLVLGAFHWEKYTKGDEAVAGVTWLPLLCVSIFIVGFSCGMGPVPWLMMGELLPLRVRGFATGIATFFNWSMAFLVTKGFNDMRRILHVHGTYWFFFAIMTVSFVVVTLFLPETKGKTLEEIELAFRGDTVALQAAVEPPLDSLHEEPVNQPVA